jgi:WhiB family transcriptional regulator, redox-sensing transcriptional regulator
VSEWVEQAVCRSVDPDMWFPDDGMNNRWNPVFKICASCPVRAECLREAFDLDMQYGIWGGTTANKRGKFKWRKRSKMDRDRIIERLLGELDDAIENMDAQKRETYERLMQAKADYRKGQAA